jgi:hypothetical protein
VTSDQQPQGGQRGQDVPIEAIEECDEVAEAHKRLGHGKVTGRDDRGGKR